MKKLLLLILILSLIPLISACSNKSGSESGVGGLQFFVGVGISDGATTKSTSIGFNASSGQLILSEPEPDEKYSKKK